jgi:hypothetical protein
MRTREKGESHTEVAHSALLFLLQAKIDALPACVLLKGTALSAKIPSHLKSFCQLLTVVNLGLLAFSLSLFIFTLLAASGGRFYILFSRSSLAHPFVCGAGMKQLTA